ncbi:MAG TPA: hypothetical protein VII56_02540 [Rhizomicrobium sp.]
MFKRSAALLFALILISGVVYLGWLSSKDSWFVAWFGIAAAFAAPLGLSLLGFAVRGSDTDVIQRLAKVPDIEKLVSEAQSYEEKIRALALEHSRLADVIQFESRRLAIEDRIQNLEADARRIVEELDSLDRERSLIGEKDRDSGVSEEVEQLRRRIRARQRGDTIITIGGMSFSVDFSMFDGLPFGFLFHAIVKVLEAASNFIETGRLRNMQKRLDQRE